MRIMLVDDSMTSRTVTANSLRNMGHTVVESADGLTALGLLIHDAVDLILLDVDMPVIDGYETARRIRAQSSDSQWVPIIFLSSRMEDEDVACGIEAGGDDYITKPVSTVVLRAKIRAMQRITDMRTRLVDLGRELQQVNASLRQLSAQDGLTGIANRRELDRVLDQEWRRAGRQGHSLTLIMCDVDHFKRYNDTYGHQGGDECLRAVAQAINRCARRPADVTARYGGEEFALLLPETSAAGALEVAGHVLIAVRDLKLPHQGSPVAQVTVSVGVAACVPDKDLQLSELVRAADQALYQAKEQGRNRAAFARFDSSPKTPRLTASL